MRRRLILLSVVVFLVVISLVVWKIARFPPVRLLIKYGLPSSMGSTGKRITIEGVEFIEISPGYFLMGSEYFATEGDTLGRISARVGLPWGDQPEPSNEMPLHWGEFENGFWIARTEVTNEQYERFKPEQKRRMESEGDDLPVSTERTHEWEMPQRNPMITWPSWLSLAA